MLDPDPFDFHVFVSYTTREDEVKVLLPHLVRFVRELNQRGFRAHDQRAFWLDQIEIGKFEGPDDQLRCTLARAIDSCIAMIGFISPGYIASKFCRFEWSHMDRTSPPRKWAHLKQDALEALRAKLEREGTQFGLFCFQLPIIWKSLDRTGRPGSEECAWTADFKGERHICLANSEGFQRALDTSVDFLARCYRERMARWPTNHIRVKEYRERW